LERATREGSARRKVREKG
jgi:hypothetical protein